MWRCTDQASVPQTVVNQVEAAGARHVELSADLRDPDRAPELVEKTIAALGSIDILVNNAGTIRRAPAVDFTTADWNDVIATNLTSVFRLSQSAGRHMLKQGSGKIINIASLLSFQGGVTVPSYAAAKGGPDSTDQSPGERVGLQGSTGQRHCARVYGNRQHRGSAQRPHAFAANSGAHSGRPVGITPRHRGSSCISCVASERLYQRTNSGRGWRLAG